LLIKFSYRFWPVNISLDRSASGISKVNKCFYEYGAGGNFALQTAAKPLQIATLLLLTLDSL